MGGERAEAESKVDGVIVDEVTTVVDLRASNASADAADTKDATAEENSEDQTPVEVEDKNSAGAAEAWGQDRALACGQDRGSFVMDSPKYFV